LIARRSPRAHSVLQALAKTSAQFEADVGVQHDLVLAAFLQLEPPHPFEVDNDRAVDTEECASVQVLLEFLDCPAHDVRGAAQVQARIKDPGPQRMAVLLQRAVLSRSSCRQYNCLRDFGEV
jgi:hypothetical protein